jgi:hypothetical protein
MPIEDMPIEDMSIEDMSIEDVCRLKNIDVDLKTVN